MNVRHTHLQSLYVIVTALAVSTTALAQSQVSPQQLSDAGGMRFTENRGQIVNTLGDLCPDILYTASSRNVKVFFRPSGLSYVFFQTVTPSPHHDNAPDPLPIQPDASTTLTTYRMDMELVGANPRPVVTPEQQTDERITYYTAQYPAGITGIGSFRRLVYSDVYPNIDLVLYGNGQGMKYDFVVHPGGRVEDIRIRYIGAENVKATNQGTVVASNPAGIVEEGKIFSYQGEGDGAPQEGGDVMPVGSSYSISNGVITFDIPSYDPSRPLVIDPPVMWSTYCGGSSTDMTVSWNHGATVIDQDRNVLITGSATSIDFPVTPGAFQTFRMGASFTYDAYVAKFTPDGGQKWATYFGGSLSDISYGITTDRDRNVVFVGTTTSYDFPTTPGAFRPIRTSSNSGFVVKLDAEGNRLWATYYPNTQCHAVAADRFGNILVGGTAWSGMPTTADALQRYVNRDGSDGFIAKFTPSGALSWSTYYGGASFETVGSITTDSRANVLISGYTMSADFPVDQQAFQPNMAGDADAFLIRLDSIGNRTWATFFGGARSDYGYGIAVDPNDNVLVTGYTYSTDLPTTPETFQPKFAGSMDGFIARFDAKGNRSWASYFGGSSSDLAYNVAVDGRGNAWIAGYTYSADLPVTSDAYQLRSAGSMTADAMVAQFDSYGHRLWATYLGGSSYDYATGIATSPIGVVVTGNTLSMDMPITNDAFQRTNAGNYDAFITQFCNVTASTISVIGAQTLCQGDSTILSAPAGFQHYLWSNGETTPDIVVRQSGRYQVTLGVSGCYGTTDPMEITVYPTPRRVIGVIGSSRLCGGDSAVLTLGGGLRTYRWSTGETTPTIVVREPGSYSAVFTDSNGCVGRTDTLVVTQSPRPAPVIAADGPLDFCDGGSVTLDAGAGYSSYRWSNGETTRRIVATRGGIYTVQVANDAGCWSESAPMTVVTRQAPSVKIAPLLPTIFCQGDSTILTASERFSSYRWSTGETTRAITVRKAGVYTLTVANDNGCSTTASITVQTALDPSPTITMNRSPRICLGDAIVLDAGDGYSQYLWNTGQMTQRIVVSEPGQYSVRVTNSLGCSGTSSVVTIEVVERPIARFNGARMVCENAMAVYTAPPADGLSYWWVVSGAGGKIIDGNGTNRITVRWGGQGAGIVRLTTGFAGYDCTADTAIAVKVGSGMMPMITADGPTSICPGGSVMLDAGDGYAGYRWSNGATTRSIIVGTPGSYDVTVTTADGCSGVSEPVAVTTVELPEPVITPLGTTTFCAGDSVILDAGAGYSSYRWSNGANTRHITVHDADVYAVTVTNSGGCSATSPAVRTAIAAPPAPVITGPSVVCNGSQVMYSTPKVDGYTYTWQPDGGTVISGQGTSTALVQWDDNGTGRLDVVQHSQSNACAAAAPTMMVSIADRLQPTIGAEGPTEICDGQSVVLDAGPGFDAYRWSNGATTRTITVDAPGDYSVHVTLAQCSGSSMPLTVTAREAVLPTIAAQGPTEFCEGDQVVLKASDGFARYLWSTGATTSEITVDRSGVYAVTVIDTSGCTSASTEIPVTVHPLPARPTIVGNGDILIAPEAAGYEWRYEGRPIEGATGPQLTPLKDGRYTVTVRNSAGCEATSEPFSYHRIVVTPPSYTVRLDTASSHVGNRLRLTMYVSPALSRSDDIRGYRAWVHIPQRSFFVHRAFSPDETVAGGTTNVVPFGNGSYMIERQMTQPPLSGNWLFQMELEGLSTGVPVNTIMIDSVQFTGAEPPTIAGNGLVLLSGCDVSRGFEFGKRVRIQAIRPNPVRHDAAIIYRAPAGLSPTLRLINTIGQVVLVKDLPAGTDEDQEVRIDLGTVASGTYTLELRDSGEISMMPLVIRK